METEQRVGATAVSGVHLKVHMTAETVTLAVEYACIAMYIAVPANGNLAENRKAHTGLAVSAKWSARSAQGTLLSNGAFHLVRNMSAESADVERAA